MNRLKSRFCATISLCLFSITPAQAATCWGEAAATAATVRTFETMLMVGALRCRNSGNNILPDYSRFVERNRGMLVGVNETLRAHFAGNGGLNAYDRYVTSIANRFGGGQDGMGCSEMRDALQTASSLGGSPVRVAQYAQSLGVYAQLPGGRCPARTASTRG